VQGVNDTHWTALIGALGIWRPNHVDRISKGDIPPKITDSYNGDFNTIKNNLKPALRASADWSEARNTSGFCS